MAVTRAGRLLAPGAALALIVLSLAAAPASAAAERRSVMMPPRGAAGAASTSGQLFSHGGNVQVAPSGGHAKVYLVLWGSQWKNDPSGEAGILEGFLGAVGGSKWDASVIQYCQGVASGTYFCNGAGTPADGTIAYAGVWADNASSAPNKPRQSQLAAEAVRAAGHFGNTTSASNSTVQYVIATAHGANANGFGTQYCAWHSSTSSSYGTIGYTNLPYITDAGAGCGAGFNGLSATAGITIVEGHELAETQTDIYPNGGWLDSSGAENGDKCAWNSATSVVNLNGGSYPVQPLWSNAANNSTGGCVLTYP